MRVISIVALAATAADAGKIKGSQPKRGGIVSSILRPLGMAAGLTGAVATPNIDISEKLQMEQGRLQDMLSSDSIMRQEFHSFAGQNGRNYVEKSESHYQDSTGKNEHSYSMVTPKEGQEDLYEQKFLTFKDNVAMAAKRNIDGEGKVVHSVTKFMDLTPEEFKGYKGLKITDKDTERFRNLPKWKPRAVEDDKSKFLAATRPLTTKNWADDGMTSPIKDQGQCGSCWAHSAVEQLESMAAIQGVSSGFDVFVGSPQEVVSCDTTDNGCGGGNPMTAFDYLGDHPLEPESDYPYTSGDTQRSGTCKFDRSEGKLISVNPQQVSSDASSESDMQDYIGSTGPLSIAVSATSAWQTYTGGVLPSFQCEGQIDHAVQLVGIDEDANTWTVRNSWGETWGEMGMIRLKLGENACHIAEMASTTDAQSADSKKLHNKTVIV